MITDAAGRLLFCGQTRPGSIHDLTQARQAGLVEPLALIPGVTLLADAGYQGLST